MGLYDGDTSGAVFRVLPKFRSKASKLLASLEAVGGNTLRLVRNGET